MGRQLYASREEATAETKAASPLLMDFRPLEISVCCHKPLSRAPPSSQPSQTNSLCDVGQVTSFPWAFLFPSVEWTQFLAPRNSQCWLLPIL